VLDRVWKLDLDKAVTFGLFIAGAAIIAGGYRLKIGTVSVPEPGFFPFIAGTTIAALSMCRLVGSGPAKSEVEEDNQDSRPASWKAIALSAALIAYTLILDWCGFVLATSLLAIAVMRISYPQSWLRTVIVSVVVAAASYYLFSGLLQVPLPAAAYY
jgi:putative tricarboxylic transport membrane protein